MALVFQNALYGGDTVGAGGGNLGAFGISDGLALEFDTHQNAGRPLLGDLANDHVAWVDTDTAQFAGASGPLDVGNIEDGDWHSVTVTWDVASQTLRYTFDGQPGATLSGDLASSYFGGSQYVHVGFTGATGGASNLQQVRAVDLQATIAGPTAVDEAMDTIANMGGDVVMTGSARHIETSGAVTLTADAEGLVGAVMSRKRIDLNSDFDISFKVYSGFKELGADGLTFVLHNSPFGADAIGGGGGNLGAFGISDGLSLEFDGHQNLGRPALGDIAADHSAWVDTDTGNVVGGTGPMNLGNIENGQWQSVTVSWDSDSQLLSYAVDGQQGATIAGNIANRFFDGSDYVLSLIHI